MPFLDVPFCDEPGLITQCCPNDQGPFKVGVYTWGRFKPIPSRGQWLSRHPIVSPLFVLFRSGVGLIIDLGQMLIVEVCVDLCGGEIGMPQEFLHGAQIA